MKNFFSGRVFSRITSNGKFVPEVDGLRFIAIFSVVIYHMNGFFTVKVQERLNYSDTFMTFWNTLLGTGNVGVPLFFVISGYILGLPFANQYIGNGKEVSLPSYFMRRLTRLEPPYILCMLALFFMSIYVVHKYTFIELLPSLLASLTYTHNFFWGREIIPLINGVAWSLEIEVQFYILAPLLAKIFVLPVGKRRITLLLLCLAMITLKSIYQLPFRSIVDSMHFFLIGFFLADLRITGDITPIPRFWVIVAGWAAFLMIFVVKVPMHKDSPDFFLNMGLFIAIAFFYYFCLFHNFFHSFLTNKVIYTIGGMCYSIYMLHAALISMVGNPFVSRLLFKSFYLNMLVYNIVLLTFIMFVSTIFFLLIERPCMDKHWPAKLVAFFKRENREKERSIYTQTEESRS